MAENLAREAVDEILLRELLAGHTYKVAGATAGVDERTARRHAQTPEFQERFRDEQQRLNDEMNTRIVAHSLRAVDTLVELLDDVTNPRLRLQAAQAILSRVDRTQTVAALQVRIEQLEAMQEQIRDVEARLLS